MKDTPCFCIPVPDLAAFILELCAYLWVFLVMWISASLLVTIAMVLGSVALALAEFIRREKRKRKNGEA